MDGMEKVMKNRTLRTKVKSELHNRIIVLALVYKLELWNMRIIEIQKTNVLELNCLVTMAKMIKRDIVK